MTFAQVYEFAGKTLERAGNECFRSDVDNIFRYYFKMNKAELILSRNKEMNHKDKEKILEITEKRKNHIPLQYIFGIWDFMGMEFEVGEGVLIPRDDTSVLVNESTDLLREKSHPKIVDLCCGSGCIAIVLEKILRNSPQIYGIEISEKAFEYFKKNIKKHDSKVISINEDIFTACDKFESNSIDAIISNPPYVRTSELSYLQPEVKLEPTLALDGGEDGLDFYKKICECWVNKLKKNGLLAFELGIGQFQDVKKIMINKGIKNIRGIKDINNIIRVITGIKN